MTAKRRSQAERRAETHKLVLASACRLFGERGYAATSLDDIAVDCGVTTRPIYHYFGNKKALFAAVNEAIARSKELERDRMATVAGGIGLPGMPGLGGAAQRGLR